MAIECSICHKPLDGTLDTYGDVHEPMCSECFFTRDPKSEAELADLEDGLKDLECDLIEANEHVRVIEGDIFYIQRKIKALKSGKRGDISQELKKLSAWREKVAA
jgi:hypothetical protein